MMIWLSLIGGVLLGWLIEWVIDWYYWRRGAEAFYIAERDLRRELAEAQQQADAAAATNDSLRAQLSSLQQEVERLRGAKSPAQSSAANRSSN